MVKCEVEECENKACYGTKQQFATRCKDKKHIEKDMVHNPRMYCSHEKQHSKCEDCINDFVCGFDGCEDKSTYGKKQRFPTRCKIKEHREEWMVTKPREHCVHDTKRYRCKPCSGASICEHDKRRSQCKLCDGSEICEHNKRRIRCRLCCGASICDHNKQRNRCHICKPESNVFCIRRYNNGTRCIKRKSSRYDNYCATCFIELFTDDPRSKAIQLPTKEFQARQQLNIAFPNRFIYDKQLFIADREEKCTSFNRRIDAQAEFDDCILAIEVDENQHKYYNPMDEELRIMQIYQDAGKNLIFIRFNPDGYKVNGKIKNPRMLKRYQVLKEKINEIIDKIEHGYKFEKWYTEIKLFFDEGQEKPDTAIRCSGFSKKAQRQCLNKVTKAGEFCYKHKSQALE